MSTVAMIHDVIIIGAGPCGLAVAARLCEPSPSALFTDVEHARFWGRPRDKNTIENAFKNVRSKQIHQDSAPGSNRSIIVFDAHSTQWMSSWRAKFKGLRISHLRSPLFFHPDPQDRDGLLAYAHFQGRDDELCEIQNVVGREVSKHKLKKDRSVRAGRWQSTRHLQLDNRDQNDYFTPSSSLFDSYVNSIVDRYALSDTVKRASVVDIRYDILPGNPTKVFNLTTSTGQIHLARTVILAAGPVNIPQVPPTCPLLSPRNQYGSAVHVFDSTKDLVPPHLSRKIETGQPTTVVVVGGGLTSAQIADLLLTTHTISKVHLVFRSRLKVKHFDVDLPWVAKLRNREMATFWSADTDEERFEMLKAARGGGSITPTYNKVLTEWLRKGRLELHTEYQIDAEDDMTVWKSEEKSWSVVLKPSSPSMSDTKARMRTCSTKMINQVDHIIFATSTPPSIHALPLLNSLRQSHPMDDINGLPVLTQDLMWHPDVPLFVTGALAGLRLGPGAGNLGGARLGAERIAWGIEKWLENDNSPGLEDDVASEPLTDPHHDTDGGKFDQGDLGYDRRDSGYASGEGSLLRKGSDLQERERELWADYTSGLGNRFDGLALAG